MSIQLSQCFIPSEIAAFMRTEFNKFAGLGVKELSESESTAITTLINNSIINLLNCDTVYDTIEHGKLAIKNYVLISLFPLVSELRNQIFALYNDMGKEHTQDKFNPVGNDNVEKAPVKLDTTRFDYATNMLTNSEFLINNTRHLSALVTMIKRDLIVVL